MKIDEHKELILNSLKEKEKSSTELSSIMGRNYYDTLVLLESLEKEKLIEKISIGNYTYWKLGEKYERK